jgi:hypothetical protein
MKDILIPFDADGNLAISKWRAKEWKPNFKLRGRPEYMGQYHSGSSTIYLWFKIEGVRVFFTFNDFEQELGDMENGFMREGTFTFKATSHGKSYFACKRLE